jgi:hypothetical protein
MFLRILNRIGSTQVIAHGECSVWEGICFMLKAMPISWMSKAMKGDVPGSFIIVCSLVIEKAVARTEESGLMQNSVEHPQRNAFSDEETTSLKPLSGIGMQTINLVRGMLVATLNPVEI